MQYYFWQDLGAYGPAWGMLGTLLGLIDMMKSMGSNVDAIGAGMALALITTLYGSMLANWICIPIGRKLEKSSNEELLIMEVVFSIVYGKKDYTNEQIKSAWCAMKTVLYTIPVAGVFTFIVSIIAIIAFLSDMDKLGPHIAVAMLSVFYCCIAESLLIPTAVRLYKIALAFIPNEV